MREAQLIFHTKHDFKGNLEQLTCEWEGPKDGVLAIHKEFMPEINSVFIKKLNLPRVGDAIRIGPFNLKVFEFDGFRDVYRLVRTDSFLGNIKVIAYRLTRWLDLAYRRLIITAAVWKLAEYRPERYPSWQDLYIVQWLKRYR